MVFLVLTHGDADVLARTCPVPTIRAELRRAVDRDVLPYDHFPRTLICHDTGTYSSSWMVAYSTPEAADAAFEAHWRALMKDPWARPSTLEALRAFPTLGRPWL